MSKPTPGIAPGAWLGMLGGGQLGRMWVHAAQSLGYRCLVLDPDPQSPAGRVAEEHLQADYLDPKALHSLGERCVAVSTEFENVPAQALAQLAHMTRVTPNAEAVSIAQDRAREKAHFQACGVPVAPHQLIERIETCAQVSTSLLPGILKTARFGYDGKGQQRVKTREELLAAFNLLGGVPCVLEQMLPLQYEVSVIVARNPQGEIALFDPVENRHRHHILDLTLAPARIPEAMEIRLRIPLRDSAINDAATHLVRVVKHIKPRHPDGAGRGRHVTRQDAHGRAFTRSVLS